MFIPTWALVVIGICALCWRSSVQRERQQIAELTAQLEKLTAREEEEEAERREEELDRLYRHEEAKEREASAAVQERKAPKRGTAFVIDESLAVAALSMNRETRY